MALEDQSRSGVYLGLVVLGAPTALLGAAFAVLGSASASTGGSAAWVVPAGSVAALGVVATVVGLVGLVREGLKRRA